MDNFRPVTAVEQLLYEILQEQYKTNELLQKLISSQSQTRRTRKTTSE